MDALGEALRRTPHFKGKGRLVDFWMRRLGSPEWRFRALPGGSMIRLNLAVPYEAMIWLGWEEPQELSSLSRLLSIGDTFVDCGANIGLWTLVAAAAVGEPGHVFAFEPNPTTCRRLNEHLTLNELSTRTTVSMAALGDRAGVGYVVETASHNLAQVHPTNDSGATPVDVVTLDDTLDDTDVAGIKIDVEGSELSVLRGAESTLRKCKPWIAVEFNTVITGVNSLDEWDVHFFLSDLGYVAGTFPASAAGVAPPPPDSFSGHVNICYRPTDQ